MSWSKGNQKPKTIEDINAILMEKHGFLDEREAKILLYKFMRENITFTTELISGIRLFPFQHMAVKSMFSTDYFMGVWSRGMSKSFTTGNAEKKSQSNPNFVERAPKDLEKKIKKA